MRTLILVVATLFVLTLGYMAYWWMQPTERMKVKKGNTPDAALPLVQRDTDKPYGPGKNVWIKKFNEDTARLASRFKANDYQPRNDGWILVKQPRAQFFMNDGRAILIEGDTGEVIMDDNDKKGMKAFSGSRDTPSRGRLYNVTIYIYHDVEHPEEQLEPSALAAKKREDAPHLGMTIKLNNASFDNQTFKIYSEAYGRGKNHVEADQVPVVLRGEDYDFDGRGLLIRWNERDRRLQLLEVAHGDRLIIKHPNTFMKKEEPAVALDGPLPIMLAARTRAATAEAINAATPTPAPVTAGPTTRRYRPSLPKPKITPNTDPPLYRAIFHDQVKIVQGEDLLVTSNKMSVDFLMQDQDNPEAPATTQPAAPTAQKSAATAPTTQLAHKSPRRTPTTQAAPMRDKKNTDEEEIPVVITWTGKLVVEPLAVGPENPIKDGEAVIRLDGTPVAATQQGSTIYSGTLTYRTEDQAMLLTPLAPDKPVIMTDTKGSLVHTTRMDFFQPKHQAILYGVSDALFPQEDESGKPGAPLLAKWTKTCTLYFANQPGAQSSGQMDIERAELEGNVDVTHPQLKLKSDALELTFDPTKRPPTTAPTGAPRAHAELPIPARANLTSPELAAAQQALAEVKSSIKDLGTPLPPGQSLEAKSQELQTLESKVALQAKAIKDIETAGQIIPRNIRDDFDNTRKTYESAKANFDQTQKAIVNLQELKGEQDRLTRHIADLQRQADLAASLPSPGTPGEGRVRAGAADQQLAALAQVNPTTKALGASATRPATTRPAIRNDLRQLVATGTVHCEMTDSAKKTQTIDCKRLTMQTAAAGDGKIYPQTVNADGEVHAVDPDQDLRAGHLAVTLRPTTQPSKSTSGGDNANAELKSMIAHDAVKVISKDGTITTADQLLVDNKDGHNNIKLLGQPFAKIVDKKSTLTGPIIEIFPDNQQLNVVGGGNMKGVQQEKAGEPERPIDVTWIRGLAYDGKSNVVDVTGQVVAVTTDADGATNTARGERMKMLLADVQPTTRPTTQASATQPTIVAIATTQPTTKPSKTDSGMASKNVRHITFDQNAEVSSVTMADDGTLLRRTHLEASTVQYDLLLKKLVVPVEGRMIVEDHRPTTQPTAAAQADARPAAAKVDDSGENNRGSTAFQWSKRFTYDDAIRQAVMEGDKDHKVVVVHRDDSPKAQLFRLTGETVMADLEEVPLSTTKPAAVAVATTGPTTKPAEKQTKVQLKKVTALGHLLFTGPGAEINALYMEYDPRTHWLIARGNERERVDFAVASQPGGHKLAEEVHYNLDTGEVKATGLNVRMPR